MDISVREMPVGIQDFEKLRNDGCIYVDKTQYVYTLTRKSRPYFLGPLLSGASAPLREEPFCVYPEGVFSGKKGTF